MNGILKGRHQSMNAIIGKQIQVMGNFFGKTS